jgi:hypothetical protein
MSVYQRLTHDQFVDLCRKATDIDEPADAVEEALEREDAFGDSAIPELLETGSYTVELLGHKYVVQLVVDREVNREEILKNRK